MDAHLDPARRHDAVLLFDVTDGNPNGDPDLEGQPRTDDETGHGLVTDVAVKRKIRDTVALLHGDDPRYGIFVEAGHALTPRWTRTRDHADGDPIAAVCARYWDVRMFGAVLTGGRGSATASVRGPAQVTFARSLHPVAPTDHTITRVTQSRQEDIDKGETTELGRKWTVPYGLYRAHVHVSAPLATRTGVTADDLAALWQAIAVMFDHDWSAARGQMATVGLWVFSHPTPLGVAPARALQHRIRADLHDEGQPPRRAEDYQLTVDRDALPGGITATEIVNVWA